MDTTKDFFANVVITWKTLETIEKTTYVSLAIANGWLNVYTSGVKPAVKAFAIGAIGGFVGGFVSIRHPGAGAAVTSLVTNILNKTFDEKPLTKTEAKWVITQSLISGVLGGICGYFSPEEIGELEHLLMGFDFNAITSTFFAAWEIW